MEKEIILKKIYNGKFITQNESFFLFDCIIENQLNLIELTSVIIAMKVRGETPEEITGAAIAILRKAKKFPSPNYDFADIVGTGGDSGNNINISTASAFVAATCGVKIAKHGNISNTRLGSFNLLQKLGININITAEQSRFFLDHINLCFLFSNNYHFIFQNIQNIRQTIKVKTIFNILGPLINPARPKLGLIGVYHPFLLLPVAKTLQLLGYKRAIVVNSGNIDKVSLHKITQIVEVQGEKIFSYQVSPENFGLPFYSRSFFYKNTDEQNYEIFIKILQGKSDKFYEELIAINVALLLKLFNHEDLYENAKWALQVIRSGESYKKVLQLTEKNNEQHNFRYNY
ncbi:anthranilate phosphoribosyltransferase [Candidatus Tachikawaea gelatinosa]|nr:anthranilate phosphoribosyltransferase [Candidatus Tachikawaea gelatinosa]